MKNKTTYLLLISLSLLLGSLQLKALDSLKCIAEFKPFNTNFVELGKGNGDLNGDGFKDIVIAKGISELSHTKGEIKIYFGSTEFDTIPDAIIYEDSLHYDNWLGLGSRIAYSGDINGDGCDDLIVSAHLGGPEKSGYVFIYLGGEDFDTEVDYTLTGTYYGYDSWGLQYGFRIDNSGDFNGDNINDLVISTPSIGGFQEGQVDIFFGGKNFDLLPDFHKVGSSGGQLLGYNIEQGDFNGDGYDDLFVQSGELLVASNEDIQIFKGGEEISTVPTATFMTGYYQPLFPFNADGDINGDGFDDVLHAYTANGNNFGAIFRGNHEFELNYDDIFLAPEFFDRHSKNSYIDINGDEYSDIIACNYRDSTAQIHCGSTDINNESDFDFLIIGHSAGNGHTINIGNINKRGFDDILTFEKFDSALPGRIKIYSNDHNGVGIIDNDEFPIVDYQLKQNYPNPFNPETTIIYDLKKNAKTTMLKIFNSKGEIVKEFNNLSSIKGNHSLQFRANNLNSGLYFYSLIVDGIKTETKKMMLVK